MKCRASRRRRRSGRRRRRPNGRWLGWESLVSTTMLVTEDSSHDQLKTVSRARQLSARRCENCQQRPSSTTEQTHTYTNYKAATRISTITTTTTKLQQSYNYNCNNNNNTTTTITIRNQKKKLPPPLEQQETGKKQTLKKKKVSQKESHRELKSIR